MKSGQITITDCEAMTFGGTFPKNVARIEWAAHQERLYNACIWLKKIHFANNCPKMPNIPLDHFQEQSSGGFLLKRCSWEFRKIHRKSPLMESLLNKVAVPQSATLFKKETPAQAFSYEFGEIFKRTSGWLLGFSLFQERFLFIHFFL